MPFKTEVMVSEAHIPFTPSIVRDRSSESGILSPVPMILIIAGVLVCP